MAESQFPNSYPQHSKFLTPNSWPHCFFNYEEDPKSSMNSECENEHEEDEVDSILCLSGSRLITSGFISSKFTGFFFSLILVYIHFLFVNYCFLCIFLVGV